MIVVDSSAWIEFFRKTGSAAHRRVRALLAQSAEVALTEIVAMELLMGARSPRHLAQLRAHVLAFPILPLQGVGDYDEAAALWRTCRAGGVTIRTATDCLIAVPVIRAGATLLHHDRDFDLLAKHTALQIEPVRRRRG